MSVAKVIEINSSSSISFEDAIQQGIKRTAKTVEHVAGAWIKEMKVDIKNGEIKGYRVAMQVTFVLND